MANQSDGDQNKKKGPGINDMILGGIKSRSGKETTKWISNLTAEQDIVQASTDASAQASSSTPAAARPPAAVLNQTQVKWVDMLFDYFQQYSVEFNRAVQSADLNVDSERPIITADLIARMQGNDSFHYSGRLHTRYWTLAVLGNLTSLEGYVIPSEHFIGFEKNRKSYTQFFEFIPIWDGELKWTFDHGAIGVEQLATMAKQVFGHLVKVAKGEADDQQRFGFGLPVLSKQSAASSSPAISSSASASAPSDYLLHHGGVFDEGPATQTRDSSPLGESQISQSSQHYVSATAAAGMPSVAQSFSSSSAQSAASVQPTLVSNEFGLNDACDILSKAVEKELELLSKAGAKAFEDHDFSRVEKLMKRTSKMKGLRDQMLNTIKDWKQILGEE